MAEEPSPRVPLAAPGPAELEAAPAPALAVVTLEVEPPPAVAAAAAAAAPAAAAAARANLPRPFRNVGNSCFVNASVQAAFGLQTWRELLARMAARRARAQ